MKDKILVCGAGAVGVYFGGRLAQSGCEVSVVARSDYEAALRNGYDIKSRAGDFHFMPHRVLRRAGEYGEAADFVILSSKILPGVDQTALVRDALESSPDAKLVLMQNGIGIEEPMRQAFPHHEIISAVAYIGSSRPAPGKVLHTGAGNLHIGNYPSGAGEGVERLSELFAAGGVECRVTDNIALCRWKKLLWNLPYNPVSVLGGSLSTGEMTMRDSIEELTIDLMHEVAAVASSCGVELTEEMIEQNIQFTRDFPPYKTSMLQDFESGRALETGAILGNAVDMARRNGVKVPKMEVCYALLQTIDRKNREKKR